MKERTEHWRLLEWLAATASFACQIKLKRQRQRTNWLAINCFYFLSHLLSLSLSFFHDFPVFFFAGMWLHHCAENSVSALRYWWRYFSGSVTSIQCWTHWFTPTSIVTFGRHSKIPWNACSSIAGTKRHRTVHIMYNKMVQSSDSERDSCSLLFPFSMIVNYMRII